MTIKYPGYCVDQLRTESNDKQEQAKGLEWLRHVQIHYQHMAKHVLDNGTCPKYFNWETYCYGCKEPNKW